MAIRVGFTAKGEFRLPIPTDARLFATTAKTADSLQNGIVACFR
jgi:hypothetical protein